MWQKQKHHQWYVGRGGGRYFFLSPKWGISRMICFSSESCLIGILKIEMIWNTEILMYKKPSHFCDHMGLLCLWWGSCHWGLMTSKIPKQLTPLWEHVWLMRTDSKHTKNIHNGMFGIMGGFFKYKRKCGVFRCGLWSATICKKKSLNNWRNLHWIAILHY